MLVLKRDGRKEQVKFDKIFRRISRLCKDLKNVDAHIISQKVIQGLFDGVSSRELDRLAIEVAYSMSVQHPDFDKLALKLAISSLHKDTASTFSDCIEQLYSAKDPFGNNKSVISEDLYKIVKKHAHILNNAIDYSRDYSFDYFGYRTLERSYLLRVNEWDAEGNHYKVIAERPQHMWMRVAVGIHGNDVESAINTYEMLSTFQATHATPTLFNAGTVKNQCFSCFAPGTQVFTFNDGIKNIENIKIGDKVLTHQGNIRKVLQLHKNKLNDRQLFDFKVNGSPKFTVTDNHRFLSITKEQINWGEKPQWNPVYNLRVGDYISIGNIRNDNLVKEKIVDLSEYIPKSFATITYKANITNSRIDLNSEWIRKHKLNKKDKKNIKISSKNNSINRFIKIDADFGYFLGVWLGDGCILQKRDKTKKHTIPGSLSFSSHKDNVKLICWLENYAKNNLGIDAMVSDNYDYNWKNISINSVILAKFFNDNFGHGFDCKKIGDLINNLDKDFIISLIEGLISSDGCITKNQEIRISMCNDLIKHVYMLCRAHNIPVAYSKSHKIYKEELKFIHRISIPKTVCNFCNIRKIYPDGRLHEVTLKKQSSQVKEIDGQVFLRISQKNKTTKDIKYVYTLGVEKDHSYMVEGLIAENCFLQSMKADSITGIYDTLKESALISQTAGGIGVHIHQVRSKGSPIYGTGGFSNGIIPMLKNFNETMRYIDQCFTGDTIVYTSEGPKPISEIAVGDFVYGSSGKANEVKKVFRNRRHGSVISLGVKQSIKNVKVRHDHPFLILKNQKKMTNFSVIKNRLDRNIIEQEWISAEDLTDRDLIAFPIPQTNIDYSYTNDDCRFYGLMLGDGWISSKDTEGRLFLNTQTDQETINFAKKYLIENGIGTSVYTKGDNKSCTVVRWTVNSAFKFGRIMLYNGKEKNMHKSMLHLPKEKTLNIVKGLLESDGCIGAKQGQEILLEMTSKNVIEATRYLLLRFGILTCGYERDRKGNLSPYRNITTKKNSYVLRVPKVKDITDILNIEPGHWVTFFKHGNFVYSRVKEKKEVFVDETVYDLEVEPDHDYVTSIGIAHNGGGKRKGSAAIYLEPWHADIFEFLDLRKNNGKEELRARDLNLALWAPDLFFKRVKEDGEWTLMDPNRCKGLSEVYGEEFDKLYTEYEEQKAGEKTVKARDLWAKILESCIETGQPYLLAKDACNKKSNQKNLGTIKSSNLCVSGDTWVSIKQDLNEPEIKLTIEEVTDLFKNKPLYVKSYDILNKQVIFKEILAVAKTNNSAKVIKLKINGGKTLICTPDHQLYSAAKYIEASKMLDRMVTLENDHGYVINIIEQSDEIPVYDLTVKDTENFFANGILVHNCAEIVEYSDPEETAVCCLASISLPACLDGKKNKKFNFERLEEITSTLTENLNKLIDINYYPVETAKRSNLKHRPLGIGVQGLGTLFAQLRLPWESEEAKQLNKDIFETMYYAFLKTSNELAKKAKAPYETFKESPLSEGKFQFDLWGVKPSDRYDWEKLRKSIKKYGVRNSLGLAQMPTASCTSIQCPITLEDGSVKTIAEILENNGIDWKEIENIDLPMSLPLNTSVKVKTLNGTAESKMVHYNGYKEVYDIEFEDGKTYSFTANHQLLVNREGEHIWTSVENLQENDDIVQI